MSKLSLKNYKSVNQLSVFEDIIYGKPKKKAIIIAIILVIVSVFSSYFISNNERFYDKPIAKITSAENKASEVSSLNGKMEKIKNQTLTAIIMNGFYKGKEIKLNNTTSFSQINDLNLKVNDEVFLSIQQDSNKNITSMKILDLKRDKYIVYAGIIFTLLLLLVGGVKGFRSLASVIINISILLAVVEVFSHGYNLIVLSVIASIAFIVLSILIVSGINKKSLCAITGTIVATTISMAIAVIVIQLNHWSGIHFEDMDFLTHPPEKIFFSEILIGTLGGIMDIAISIASAITELYDKNPYVETKALINSAREIGQDIMGTMANTLVFAYISGSIPSILLLFKDGFSISYIINIDLSLEFMRALTGSIGIVLSIPITIYTSVALLKHHRIGGL